jgi:hypothetical protein
VYEANICNIFSPKYYSILDTWKYLVEQYTCIKNLTINQIMHDEINKRRKSRAYTKCVAWKAGNQCLEIVETWGGMRT